MSDQEKAGTAVISFFIGACLCFMVMANIGAAMLDSAKTSRDELVKQIVARGYAEEVVDVEGGSFIVWKESR